MEASLAHQPVREFSASGLLGDMSELPCPCLPLLPLLLLPLVGFLLRLLVSCSRR